MCGIIGYVGREKKAKDVVLSGLKNLEYRGYDSSGIAIIKDNGIDIQKSIGKIVNLENKLTDIDMNFESYSSSGYIFADHSQNFERSS